MVYDIANNFRLLARGDEKVRFDGETHRLTLSVRRGIAARWEVGADVPYVAHHGGVFDSFIVNWHDTFGMPQAGRPTMRNNELVHEYQSERGVELSHRTETSGLGDVSLSAGYQLTGGQGGRRASLRSTLKLPTGDADRLLGSGATDWSLRVSAEDHDTLSRAALSASASLGVLLPGQGDVLSRMQKDVVAFGSLGFTWKPFRRVAGTVQTDWHTKVYHGSALKQISGWSAQLATGASILLSADTQLDLVVVEDPFGKTAPDVVFHLGLRTLL
jgi:hypothetical protein